MSDSPSAINAIKSYTNNFINFFNSSKESFANIVARISTVASTAISYTSDKANHILDRITNSIQMFNIAATSIFNRIFSRTNSENNTKANDEAISANNAETCDADIVNN